MSFVQLIDKGDKVMLGWKTHAQKKNIVCQLRTSRTCDLSWSNDLCPVKFTLAELQNSI